MKDLLDHVIEIKQTLGGHTEALETIKSQVQKTNGRVTALESTTAMLARVESQNSGIIKGLQDTIGKIEISHNDETKDRRQLSYGIIKHTVSVCIGLLAAFTAMKLNITKFLF